MAVVLETTLGDITIDLYIKQRPRSCINFLKLCKIKYYNFNVFHMVNRGFIAQTGDPTCSGEGGESIWGVIEGSSKRYFEAENNPRIKHTSSGLVSFVGDKNNMLGSQFFITLASDLMYLDSQHCIFGEVVEGLDVLHLFNEAICDNDHRPYQDIRITHTVVLEDPFPDPKGIIIPDGSPAPTAEQLQSSRLAPDEDIDETAGKSAKEIAELTANREAKARATILEMVGDIPDAEMAPPENVLFVCKLNPVTNDDDLEIIFSRFGKIKSCEVIRDKKTGDSLQYAFVEFENEKSCEDAYFKMDNVLIDDRRIHVDFSQSVAKVRWFGKGRISYENENKDDTKRDLGSGKYQKSNKRKNSDVSNPKKRNDVKSSDRRERREYSNVKEHRSRLSDERYSDRRDSRYNEANKRKYTYESSKNREYDSSGRNKRQYDQIKKHSSRYNEYYNEKNKNYDKERNKLEHNEHSRSRKEKEQSRRKKHKDYSSEEEVVRKKSKTKKKKSKKSKRRSTSTSSQSSSASDKS